MRRGSLGTLLVATLAITFLAGPGATQPPSHPGASSRAAGEPRRGDKMQTESATGVVCLEPPDLLCSACPGFCPSEGLQSLIGDFFGPKTKRKVKPEAEKEDLKEHWGVPREFRQSLEFVIAIVPDPVHTHLSLDFDREIDAIQEAVQQDGYLFSRAYTPWEPSDHPEDTRFHVRLQQKAWEASKEELPGLMVFRKAMPESGSTLPSRETPTAPLSDSLFVFLTGDSPTGGISKIQFRNAVQIIGQIRKTSKQKFSPELLPKPLKIFGPSFSGSLYSLMDTLTGELASVPVQVYSGQVSSFDTINWFNNYRKGPTSPRLLSFEESDRFITTRLIAFLRKAHYEAKDIAILSEDQTAYGSQVTPGTNSVPQTPDEAVVPRFYFPREISQLRAAYQKDVHEGEPPAGADRPSSRLTLPLNLSDARNDDDDVASYSKAQTPLSQQGVLLGIVGNLEKHHSKFVLIQASDALDEIFLVNFLRVAYPNGHIITTGADLLFQRDLEDPRLRGVLAVSSYSLAPGAYDHLARPASLTPEEHVDRVFPTSFSAGSYNAMLALLKYVAPQNTNGALGISANTSTPIAGAHARTENDKLPQAAYVGYGWPSIAGQSTDDGQLVAPLWLTAIGRGGYWPVEILSESIYTDSKKDLQTSLSEISGSPQYDYQKRHLPLPWRILFFFCLLLEAVYLYLLRTGSLLSRSDFSATFAPVSGSDHRSGVGFRNWIIFVVNILFLLVLMMLAWPLMRWTCEIQTFPLWFAFELTAFAFLSVLGVYELRRRHGVKLPVAFLICSATAPIATILLARTGRESFENFLTYRYVHVTSGVSPAVPWLLLGAAGLWWAWHTLAGVALSDRRQPRLPTTAMRRLGCADNETLRCVMDPTNRDPRVYLAALLVALLPVLAIDLRHPVEAMDGLIYEWAYALVLGLTTLVLLSGVIRLTVIWAEFRPLLVALERQPLRRGFDRLHGFRWNPIWRLGGTGLQDSYRLISREFESLDHVRNLKVLNGAISESPFVLALARVREMRKTISERSRQSEAANIARVAAKRRAGIVGQLQIACSPQPHYVDALLDDFQELQACLSLTCGAALECLTHIWGAETGVDMFEVSPRKETNERPRKPNEPQEVQLLEQFVCLFYVNFILSVLMRMRALIISAAGMLVFILLSFNSYPFQPKTLLDRIFLFLFFVVVALVVRVLAQMHRDATLSRITDTTPGELGFDFWLRLVSFVSVPLVGLLATQFPSISGLLYSWFTPAAQAFK